MFFPIDHPSWPMADSRRKDIPPSSALRLALSENCLHDAVTPAFNLNISRLTPGRRPNVCACLLYIVCGVWKLSFKSRINDVQTHVRWKFVDALLPHLYARHPARLPHHKPTQLRVTSPLPQNTTIIQQNAPSQTNSNHSDSRRRSNL